MSCGKNVANMRLFGAFSDFFREPLLKLRLMGRMVPAQETTSRLGGFRKVGWPLGQGNLGEVTVSWVNQLGWHRNAAEIWRVKKLSKNLLNTVDTQIRLPMIVTSRAETGLKRPDCSGFAL